MTTYKIMRFYQHRDLRAEVVQTGLTLEQAQEHCSDPETSSSTCTTPAGKARTKACGAWFHGYTKE
jgi:hypothetical protein